MFSQAYSGRGCRGSSWAPLRSNYFGLISGRMLGRTVVAGGSLLLAVVFCWKLLNMSISDGKVANETVETASLQAILDELTRRFFHVLREVSVVSRGIRDRMKAQGHEVGEDDKALRSELAAMCRIVERFAQIREDVLAEFNVTENAIASLSEVDAVSVAAHRGAVELMLKDALGGMAPSLPGLQIPREFTESRLLEIYSEILNLKIEKIKILADATRDKKYTPEELGKAAAMISQAAEAEVLEARQSELGRGGEIFFSAMAAWGRDVAFSERMALIESEHRRALVAAFRVEHAGPSPKR